MHCARPAGSGRWRVRHGGGQRGRIGGGRACAAALGLALWAAPAPAAAQLLDRYFPAGVIGYGAGPGVTVLSRDRQEYEPLGVRAGSVVVRPSLTVGGGYTTNATARFNGTGSAILGVAGSLLAATDWGRHGASAFISFDNLNYLSFPSQSATSWTGAVGGTVDIGRDRLVLAAAHLDLYQTARTLDGLPLDRPGRYVINNARIAYTHDMGRVSLTPGLAVSDVHYDDVYAAGRRVGQQYRNGTTYDGAMTARYELAPLRNLVAEFRVVGFDDAGHQAGLPYRDSTTFAAMAGIEFATDGVWRIRALVGTQHRIYLDPALKAVNGPSTEVSVNWMPSGLTTVTATLSRRIDDAAEPRIVSYIYSGLHLQVDHELYRNILLGGYMDLQRAEYQQVSGYETYYGYGMGATWLINRRLRASATWDWSQRRPSIGPWSSEGVGMLRLRFAM